jgi:CPA2 family monovalent cation:H+ antiporter-2
VLKDAQTAVVTLTTSSSGKGKQIRDLALRTRTGASIIAVERDGASLVNPNPEEELKLGDQLLLLGNSQQLEQARHLLLDSRLSP